MTIHHAIAKAAEKRGFHIDDLGEDEGDTRFKAHWPKLNRVLFAATAKQAKDEMWALIDMAEQYRSFRVAPGTDGDYSQVSITVKRLDGFSVTGVPTYVFAKAKAAWQESRAEMDEDEMEEDDEADVEDEQEDEETAPRSVVHPKYRARYAEAGHPDHCGDWLANLLNSYCLNKAGFNLELFGVICEANGIDMSKYKLEKPSDRGRYRMTGRNMLARRVWMTGEFKLPSTIEDGRTLSAPADWIASQRFATPKSKKEAKTNGAAEPVEAKPSTRFKKKGFSSKEIAA